jgi:hypothetical protein
MQHTFGKPLHRTTEWRRVKGCFDVEPGRKNLGRGVCDDYLTETFILFAGACIELLNTKGYCSFPDVFNGERQGNAGFRYHKVPDKLFKRLVESKFPPQLLAVVVSDLIPLNLVTRGARHTSIKKDIPAKVKNLTLRQILDSERDHAVGRPIQKFSSLNSADDIVTADSTCEEDFYEGMDERLNWHEPNETPLNQSARRLLPKHKMKGTPVYRIPFHGNQTISRRMACYWRNDCHLQYNRCKKFIKRLLKSSAPDAPCFEHGVATRGILINERDKQEWKERNAKRLASKS